MQRPDFKSILMSRPRTLKIHGITVRKLPTGRYLDMLETLGSAVYEVVEAVFPGMNLQQVLDMARHVTRDELKALLLRAMTVAPRQAVKLMARLLDVDERVITDELTPFELMEVLEALSRLNDYKDFFEHARLHLGTRAASRAASGGFSNGSQEA